MSRFAVRPDELNATGNQYKQIASDYDALSRRVGAVPLSSLLNSADESLSVGALASRLRNVQADVSRLSAETLTDGDLMVRSADDALAADAFDGRPFAAGNARVTLAPSAFGAPGRPVPLQSTQPIREFAPVGGSLATANEAAPWARFSLLNNSRQVALKAPRSWALLRHSGGAWNTHRALLAERGAVLTQSWGRATPAAQWFKSSTRPLVHRASAFKYVNQMAGHAPDLIDRTLRPGTNGTFLRRVNPAMSRLGNRILPGLGHTTKIDDAAEIAASRFATRTTPFAASLARSGTASHDMIKTFSHRRLGSAAKDLIRIGSWDNTFAVGSRMHRVTDIAHSAVGNARIRAAVGEGAALKSMALRAEAIGTAGSKFVSRATSVAGRGTGSLWRGAARLAGSSRAVDDWVTRSSRTLTSSRVRFAASKLGTAARVGGGALGVVGIVLDSASAYRSFKDGDIEGGTVSAAKAIGGGMMLFPGGQAAGAVILGGALIYENREAIASGARWLGRSTASATKWASDKLAQGASTTARAVANKAEDMISDVTSVLTSPLTSLGGLFGGG